MFRLPFASIMWPGAGPGPPRYALSERWAVTLNANYFASTSDNRFVQLTASFDCRLP